MRRLALAAAPVLVLALVLAGGVASQTGTPTPSPEASPSTSPSPSPSPSPEASPAPEPLPPAPPPTPIDPNAGQPQSPAIDPNYPGALRPGDWVQITGTDSCLNVRWEPLIPAPQPDGTTYNNVLNCLPDGFIGRLDAQAWGNSTLPVSSEGRWWWHLVGQGWAAEEWLILHHQGGIPWPERPDLANDGLIAYIARDSSIWLMNADGSEQRPIVGRTSESEYFYNLAWSPSGDQLSLTANTCCGPVTAATRIVDLNGNLIVELAGLTGARWSPDGTRLSALRHHSAAGLGDNSTPVVFDLNAGTETAVGSPSSIDTAPAWSPDSQTVTFVCTSSVAFSSAPDGSSVETRLDCGGDGLRIVPATGGDPWIILPFARESGVYYRNPSWSRDGATIAVVNHTDGAGCRGYTLVDVQTGNLGSCIAFPPLGNRGGGCGWPADASEWSLNSRYLIYSYSMGNAGNGVHIADVSTGVTTLVPSMGSSSISLQSGGPNLTFSSDGHVWVAGLDGSDLNLVAEGHSPVWQPQP